MAEVVAEVATDVVEGIDGASSSEGSFKEPYAPHRFLSSASSDVLCTIL